MADVRSKSLLSCQRCLLQTIHRFLQQDIVRSRRVNEGKRLLTIDRLLWMTIKKDILHVQRLTKRVAKLHLYLDIYLINIYIYTLKMSMFLSSLMLQLSTQDFK